jgi:hypothetical protein
MLLYLLIFLQNLLRDKQNVQKVKNKKKKKGKIFQKH